MDNILFLAHTEADGTLNKTALETLSSAIELKQSLNGVLEVALYGVGSACGQFDCRLWRDPLSCGLRRGLCRCPLCHRCRGVRSAGPGVRCDHRNCRCYFS